MKKSTLFNTINIICSHNGKLKSFQNFNKLNLTVLTCLITFSTFGQFLSDFPCYTISENNIDPNVLFEFDPQIQEWIRIGVTGGSNIEALATDALTNTIYAVDGDVFGTVDKNTGTFSAIGSPGIANGELGPMALDDIDGLTYDLVNQIMYATHRVSQSGPQTEDLLFQIDVATGKVVPGAMFDLIGNPIDYAVIGGVFVDNLGDYVYDVDDIAYNPYTGELFALQNDGPFGTITNLDPQTGAINAVIYDFYVDYYVVDSDDNEIYVDYISDVEGLGFSYLGELFVTTGNNGKTEITNNAFMFIDIKNENTIIINKNIDETGAAVDFESFDCFTAFNDLALKIKLDENTPQTIVPGDQITFQITVYNQGKFDNDEITVTNYTPEGLILIDTKWAETAEGNATQTITTSIAGGNSLTMPITFKIDENYQGNSIINVAEISSSYNVDIFDLAGNSILLLDVDSKPDNINNETNIVNDEINQGGPNSVSIADEDDHDIEEIILNNTCVTNLDLGNADLSSGVYRAAKNLSSSGKTIGEDIEFFAGEKVSLFAGFKATDTKFSADIEECED